jgi:hypothetical protein
MTGKKKKKLVTKTIPIRRQPSRHTKGLSQQTSPASASATIVAVSETEFKPFPKLPLEIRLKIWGLIEAEPKFIKGKVRNLDTFVQPVEDFWSHADFDVHRPFWNI